MSVVISSSAEWLSCLEKIGVNQAEEGGVTVPVIAERKDVSHILVLKGYWSCHSSCNPT